MVKVEDVFILKTDLFQGFLGFVQGGKVKFLVKNGEDFYDLNGNKISLFKSGKTFSGLPNDCIVCDYLSENAVLYKLYNEQTQETTLESAFRAEGFDIGSIGRTAKFDAIVFKYLLKPFVAEFEFRGKKQKMNGYKANQYQNISKKITIKGGYRENTLKAIEEFFSTYQSTKNKARKPELISKGSQELQELNM